MLAERRQVVEMEIQRKVIEYHIVGGTCACGHAQRSTFPAGIFLQGLRPRCNTGRATAYFPHPKRGAEALGAFGLLAPFAAYSCMITGQPASTTHVGMPSAMPIIYVS